MFKSLLPHDPTGEMLHIIDQLARTPAPATRDGVWVSADGARALMVAQTAAGGSDTDAQGRRHRCDSRGIRGRRCANRRATRRAAVQLKLSGPGVFAVAARAKIEHAAVRLSIASGILVVTLLLAVYRSLPALGWVCCRWPPVRWSASPPSRWDSAPFMASRWASASP